MMRKKDKLLKKRSKMDIKKCERKYRKEVQLAVAILESIAGSYRNEK